MSRILVTGATGFVGRALVSDLVGKHHFVRAVARDTDYVFPRDVEVVAISDLTQSVDWAPLLNGMDAVVHLAGIAHAGSEIAEDLYDRVNRRATEQLAIAACASGLRRMVFVSSIRAQSGSATATILRETMLPQPNDAYGRSKLAAERAVRDSGVPFTILRPVLIYGPEAKGNLARITTLAKTLWPLPFGLCSNRRSLLALENLVAAIQFSLHSPDTSGEIYIVADPEPLTIAEIIRALRAGAGRAPLLLPIPTSMIALLFRAVGRADEWERLGGTLIADPSKLMAAGWRPAIDSRSGLEAFARRAFDTRSLN